MFVSVRIKTENMINVGSKVSLKPKTKTILISAGDDRQSPQEIELGLREAIDLREMLDIAIPELEAFEKELELMEQQREAKLRASYPVKNENGNNNA